MRGLWLPAAAPWAAAVESELLKFPAGAHDDIVDTLSLIGRMIAGLETGKDSSSTRAGVRRGTDHAGQVDRAGGWEKVWMVGIKPANPNRKGIEKCIKPD